MIFISPEVYQYYFGDGSSVDPFPTASGNEGFTGWANAMKQYAETTGAAGMPSVNFWLAVQLPKNNYSDKVDFHPDLPMLVPVSGTQTHLLGVFSTKAAADIAMEEDEDHVHLLYKLKLQGSLATYKFLEFMAEHNMMEKAE